ncbi:hypothetical protein DBR40_14740 [Pedobacter sp. KBW01]|nr:hypothetical protein DBR40_14740 [Pedobacter sp. KBW01]
MKTSLIILFFLINTTCTDSTTVYICNSNSAKKYHLKSDCKGLSTCQHKILKTTLEKAKNDGKTLCGWED